ncbi:MAG: biopolymer transporter ExbD [Verrucomicrobiota bacterium]
MEFYRKRKKPLTIQIVSLIDILSILIIFFIVTTTFKVEQPEVEIELPDSSTAQAESANKTTPKIIYVTKEKEIYAGDKKIELSELTRYLIDQKSSNDKIEFALKVDKNIPFELFVKINDAFLEADIKDLSFYTDKSEIEK